MAPRIRTIKPEIWTSPDFRRLSNVGRAVFIGLITQADDAGRLRYDTARMTRDFCDRSTTHAAVDRQLRVMEEQGMLTRWDGHVDGTYPGTSQQCIALLGWARHQKVDHPSRSRIPAPPKSRESLAHVREFSRSSRARADRIGSDRIGSDPVPPKGSPVGEADALVLVPPVSLSPAEQVFEPWRLMWHPTAKLTRQRRAKIEARLREGWSIEDLVEAETIGAANDPWSERHIALNDDIKNLLRDGGTVEKFLELARRPPGAPLPRSNSRAAQLDRIYAEAQQTARSEGR